MLRGKKRVVRGRPGSGRMVPTAGKRRGSSGRGGPEEGRRGALGKDVFLEELLREMLRKASTASDRSVAVDGPFSRLDDC